MRPIASDRNWILKALGNQMNSTLDQVMSATTTPDVGEPSSGPGRVLLRVFETLERAGITFCVLHGYESYPQRVESDVDCLISRKLRPRQLIALLHENRARIGADVVRWQDNYAVLAGKNADGSPCFLKLDLCADYELGGRKYFHGSEVLDSCRRHTSFQVPAAEIEFGCYLIKKIAKKRLDDEHIRKLENLYRQNPAGCDQQIARFWGDTSAAVITAAAASGDWKPVRRLLGPLSAELRRRALLRNPGHAIAAWFSSMYRRAKQLFRPDTGVEVVILGPDGAGKSTVARSVRRDLDSAFARTACYRFPPSVLSRLLRRPEPPPEQNPHGGEPRSFAHSVIRAVLYWFGYYGPGYFVTTHLELARGFLVVHDRHLVDCLVDPRRYSYGGPPWLVRLIWRIVPKPSLVILLDAPPEVMQARKQEVAFLETARQREAYRSLVGSMSYGRVVDVSRPLDQVTHNVDDIILQQQSARVARRLGLQQNV